MSTSGCWVKSRQLSVLIVCLARLLACMLLLSGSASGQSSGCGFHRRHCPAIAPCIACCALCVAKALHSLRLSVCRPDAPPQVTWSEPSSPSSCRTWMQAKIVGGGLSEGGLGACPCAASGMAAHRLCSVQPVRAAPVRVPLPAHCMVHTCKLHGLLVMMHEHAACAGHITHLPCV